ncbi:MAG TPA: FtsX-like permease family protein [Puia sp.]|jgi:predicted permease|nr:FtsX-like permease family protein [Puia sp.]
MIRNYLKLAWRNLLKDRQFSLLNLLGLSVGLACALLIGLWIADEWGMEKYNPNDDRLYQVMTNSKTSNGLQTGMYTPGILARSLRAEYPEIQDASEVLPASWFNDPSTPSGVVAYGDKKLNATPQFVDSNFFHLFTCPILEGDKSRLFADKKGVFLSSSLAERLFGTTQDLIGKVIHFDQYDFTGEYEIRGIFQPNPPNASEKPDLLFNFDLALEKRPGLKEWGNSDPHTFVLLKPGANLAAFNGKLSHYLVAKLGGKDKYPQLFLSKFSDRYLYDHFENGARSGGRIVYVRLFSIIAIFILIIACINFMNLATARAAHRAKEVGIRKVVGAGRGNLILQYLGESILLSFVSLLVALAICELLLPVFNHITGKELTLHFAPPVVLGLLGITLLTGVFAGSYPAFYLSAFRPIAVLKGTLKTSWAELWTRKGLVVFQFTLSILFIAGVLIVYRQVAYIQSRDLGYNRDHVIDFNIPVQFDSAYLVRAASFVNELNNIPGVVNAGSHSHNLTGDHGGISGLKWPGKPADLNIEFANIEIGQNFLQTIGIKLKAGRYFSQNMDREIIMNETAIKAMGLKNPIGTVIHFWDQTKEIIGVAADYNFESLYQPVKPAFFWCHPVTNYVSVRVKTGAEAQTIAAIRKAYMRFNPGMAFEYKYLDEKYQKLYASEIRIDILSRYFAGLAILISCLGLFGLAAFTAGRRQKEIGIRKVIGASVIQLVYLVSKEFLWLVALAIVIAFPLAWLGMNYWLNEFTYRTRITADLFWLTGATVILITLLTISYQSISAALANPVKSLRSE